MAEDTNLLPVFIPPLARLLADAEAARGCRLTEPEVVGIRDVGYCVMMPIAEALEIERLRGYHDVEPENCWADWHRLRISMTGDGSHPQIILCVPGGADLVRLARPILDADGIEFEWRGRDEGISKAFQACARGFDPSFDANEVTSIGGHVGVLYVLSKCYTAQDAPIVSRAFLRLIPRLLRAGGLALKCESSGIGHGRSRWLELAQMAEGEHFWFALFRAFVQFPIKNDKDSYTCGMHLLGKPDLIVSNTLLRQTYGSTSDADHAAVDLFTIFAFYLLAECPVGQFISGQTFSTNATSPRFQVVWEPCIEF